ncbi:hypothetical protein MSPP1_003850 [Malassezia sp. CBS 17886]|nr:hypothetical protein MSPP1_003850 [Malassezia sp. CBS 17886]
MPLPARLNAKYSGVSAVRTVAPPATAVSGTDLDLVLARYLASHPIPRSCTAHVMLTTALQHAHEAVQQDLKDHRRRAGIEYIRAIALIECALTRDRSEELRAQPNEEFERMIDTARSYRRRILQLGVVEELLQHWSQPPLRPARRCAPMRLDSRTADVPVVAVTPSAPPSEPMHGTREPERVGAQSMPKPRKDSGTEEALRPAPAGIVRRRTPKMALPSCWLAAWRQRSRGKSQPPPDDRRMDVWNTKQMAVGALWQMHRAMDEGGYVSPRMFLPPAPPRPANMSIDEDMVPAWECLETTCILADHAVRLGDRVMRGADADADNATTACGAQREDTQCPATSLLPDGDQEAAARLRLRSSAASLCTLWQPTRGLAESPHEDISSTQSEPAVLRSSASTDSATPVASAAATRARRPMECGAARGLSLSEDFLCSICALERVAGEVSIGDHGKNSSWAESDLVLQWKERKSEEVTLAIAPDEYAAGCVAATDDVRGFTPRPFGPWIGHLLAVTSRLQRYLQVHACVVSGRSCDGARFHITRTERESFARIAPPLQSAIATAVRRAFRSLCRLIGKYLSMELAMLMHWHNLQLAARLVLPEELDVI